MTVMTCTRIKFQITCENIRIRVKNVVYRVVFQSLVALKMEGAAANSNRFQPWNVAQQVFFGPHMTLSIVDTGPIKRNTRC